MVYFHRVTRFLLLALLLSASGAWAAFPATRTNPDACTTAPCYQYRATTEATWQPNIATACQACINASCINQSTFYGTYVSSSTTGGVSPFTCLANVYQRSNNAYQFQSNYGSQMTSKSVAPVAATYSCPANSTLSGTQCTCTAPYTQNGANNGCEMVADCPVGQAVTSARNLGWFKNDDLPAVYSAQFAGISVPECVLGANGKACTVNYTGTQGKPIGIPGVRGYTFYSQTYTGTMPGGAQCAPTGPVPVDPEPVCEGQQGVFNGVAACLPKETQAQIDARARAVAEQAAANARQAAINAGRTGAQADAAARAAGDAAAQALRNGATASAANAAGAAAGAAAATAAAAGASASSTMSEGSAAGAGQAAADRARLIATSAGASASVITQAENAARTAAATAAANVLVNGGTQAQATQAAKIAGQTATASVLTGSIGTAASDAAAAAAGNLAGNTNGTGYPNGSTGGTGNAPQDPVGDFCTKNPQAKMCKTEEDGAFAGTCDAPPVCKGDAVLCAVAAATFKQECNWRPPASTESAAYDLAKTKTGDQTSSLPGNSSMAISAASFDQTEILGTATGMTDRVVTVMNSNITLPFSTINPWLVRLGYVLQAVTFLLCIRILTRG